MATFADVSRIALALPEAAEVPAWEGETPGRPRLPYVGRFGWVEVDLARIDVVEPEALIRKAWRLTAPKKAAATRMED